ncbi:MAG: hypothetical protein ACLR56_02780 [Oscillospiraceae bacterium]
MIQRKSLFAFGKEEADSGKTELQSSSIAVDSNGKIYLVDAVQNHILVYKPTEFAEEVHKAVTLYNDGDYNAAYDLWASVLEKARIMSLRKSVWVTLYKKNVITKLCSNTKMQMSAHCILRLLQNIDTAFSEKISVLQFP